MRFFRVAGVGLTAGVLVLSTFAPVGAVDGTLPAGISISVDVASPPEATVIPKGPTTVTGTASVGTASAAPTIGLVYVLDSSGSLGLEGYEQEKSAILGVQNAFAGTPGSGVGSVGLAQFSTVGESIPVGPGGALATGSTSDIVQAINNMRWHNAGTNFSAGITAATASAAASTMPQKIVLFVSDGRDNSGGSTSGPLSAVPPDVTFHTVALGRDASCTAGSFADAGPGSLGDIAAATGGTCTAATFENLKSVLLTIFPSELTNLTLTVDGGPDIPVTAVTPALPHSGPFQVTYTVDTPPLDVGTHPLCVTAHGTDRGGAGTVTDCTSVIILDPRAGCTYTQGFYKNHQDVVRRLLAGSGGTLAIGGVSLNADQIHAILRTSVSGNYLRAVTHQLISARLNQLGGAGTPDTIATAANAANALVAERGGPLTGTAKPNTTVTHGGVIYTASQLNGSLDGYNQGNAAGGPDHCG